jgi:NAD(P)-dependent dehydrogenase (short-subunit alcohol dehydrogenase family)
MTETRKTAIVTGGAQGIGRAITQKLLSKGWSVAVADIDNEACYELNDIYVTTERLLICEADNADEDGVKKVIQKTADIFGGIDLLVNNAGIGIGKAVTEMSLDEWNRVLSVNLTGAFLYTKYSVPLLRLRHGNIVNIASTRALMSEANTEAYSASKGGIIALTHALAVSLGPDIRVNCISPGWIETGEWQKKSRRQRPVHTDADRLQHPAGCVGTPDDIANMVLYLTGENAGFITGQNFVIDGGMTKKMIYV